MENKNDVLEKRGYLAEDKILKGREELIDLLNSSKPVDRTTAVRGLIQLGLCRENEIIKLMLEHLLKEKALYTRLEICEFLKNGGKESAKLMVAYLGKVGNNQYKSVPNVVSKKKSYPLPRDLISRTFGHMDVEILPILMDTLRDGDIKAVCEVIDAIGFMIFYNRKLSTTENIREIEHTMNKYNFDKLITWKCITCLSAFREEEGKIVLEKIVEKTKGILRMEAKRSLEFY